MNGEDIVYIIVLLNTKVL